MIRQKKNCLTLDLEPAFGKYDSYSQSWIDYCLAIQGIPKAWLEGLEESWEQLLSIAILNLTLYKIYNMEQYPKKVQG